MRERVEQWMAEYGRRFAPRAAFLGAVLLLAAVVSGLATCAPQVPAVVAEPGTEIPAASAAQELLRRQLRVEAEAVQIVTVEDETWPDACLGAPHADELCAAALTPGYRITLEVDGQQYVYHTDLEGDGIRLAGAPQPAIGEPVVRWFGSDETSCQLLEAGTEGAAFGRCGRPLLGGLYSSDQRQADLADFAQRYASFEAETLAGTIRFSGRGTTQATPAEQRMLAEWARLVYAEAEAGQWDPASGQALTWHREGGLAGFCDDMVIYLSGDAYSSTCGGDAMPVDIGRVRLDAGQLAALYNWVDTYQAFEVEQTDPATADALTLRLTLMGAGEDTAPDGAKEAMMEYAQSLYTEAEMLTGGN